MILKTGNARGVVSTFRYTGRKIIVMDLQGIGNRRRNVGKFEGIEILAHELGHVLMDEVFANTPGHVRKMVWDDYNLWRVKKEEMNVDDFFYGEFTSRKRRGGKNKMKIKEMSKAKRDYYLSKEEWFANQIMKYFVTDIKPLTAVDKFFHRIFVALSRLFNKGVKFNLPGKSMKNFLDDLFTGRYNGTMKSIANEAADQNWSTWKTDPDKKPPPKPKPETKPEGKKTETKKPKKTPLQEAEDELADAIAELDAAEDSGNEAAIKKANRRVFEADKNLIKVRDNIKGAGDVLKGKQQNQKGKTGTGGGGGKGGGSEPPPTTPEGAEPEPELPLEELLALRQQEIDSLEAAAEKQRQRVFQEARREFEMRIRGMMADEAGFGVLKSDAKSKRVATFSRRPGTRGGELARMAMQFKQFPIALTQRVLGRAMFAERSGRKLNAIGKTFLGLAIAGYIAMTIKDYGRGYGPRKVENAEQAKDLVMAALLQGGAAGIFGDFFFNDVDRFGNPLASTAAGPSVGVLLDILRLTGSLSDQVFSDDADFDDVGLNALRLAQNTVPYANHFLLRPGLEMLIINALRDFLDPGSVRRGQRRRERNYNQERHEHWPDNIFD